MTHLAKNKEHVDVVIMDPPREGSTKQFIDAIGYLKPRRVIYVSCDPNTLKRDLYVFSDNDYIVKHIEGVDMFPRTLHLEYSGILPLESRNQISESSVSIVETFKNI